jgi:hypothetical protein
MSKIRRLCGKEYEELTGVTDWKLGRRGKGRRLNHHERRKKKNMQSVGRSEYHWDV